MNIFIQAIKDGRITTEAELKRLFRRLAKELHPDADSIQADHEKFIELKRQYDEAFVHLSAQKKTVRRDTVPDRVNTVRIFVELVASGFPLDTNMRGNKGYYARIKEFDSELSKFGPEYRKLIYAAQRELAVLKGSTTIMNHDFNLVQMYLFRFSDYTNFPTKNTLYFLNKEYEEIVRIFDRHECRSASELVRWLIGDIYSLNNT